ncbi:SprT-like domain-containing protein [Acidisphaera sp. S103]|uniref:SprT-like domain-containing protein n=1 Tax=Acidisphaera sp. S103 TaxID=1747223 RepID=UPI00131C0F2F|nr:SprT-like domain-containing protein [Acidisphaera sp. S103]
MKELHPKPNKHDTRESWLRSATGELRPYFGAQDFPIPENIRFAIAFPSTGRRGTRIGECWHSSTSEDGNFEIIIRADIADPAEVLGVLVHELIHVVLPVDAGHGKQYRDAALKIGLEGQMRHAMPGRLLRDFLADLAANLGPLPHARLNIERGRENKGPADRPKKQGTRMLKASCPDETCPYVVRIAATPAREIGPPHCPKHGAMVVEWPESEELQAGEGAGLPDLDAAAEIV